VNPNDPLFGAARVWRGKTTFALAADITGAKYGAPNQSMSITDTPAPGTWNYWVTAESSSGSRSAPAGPSTVTI
jgi:hypothetical protein